MPKRSNIFQRVVALLHENLDDNWEVKESEMLTNTLTGEEREVDVVCRSVFGEHELIISIECTETKRPASSTWVEAMAQKHKFLPTSKLVLWSSNGFYKPALVTAEKLCIETVSQKNEIKEKWATFAYIFKKGVLKLIQPELEHFIDYENSKGEKLRLDGDKNYLFKVPKIDKSLTINDLKEFVLENKGFRSGLLDHATEQNDDFWLLWKPGSEWLVQLEDGDWVAPFRIGFGIKANTQQAEMIAKSVKYLNSVYTLSTGKTKNGIVEIFVKETKPTSN